MRPAESNTLRGAVEGPLRLPPLGERRKRKTTIKIKRPRITRISRICSPLQLPPWGRVRNYYNYVQFVVYIKSAVRSIRVIRAIRGLKEM